MIRSLRSPRLVTSAALAFAAALCSAGAFAAPTLNSSGLTPQQCYSRDSSCTQMCGQVTGDLRYECFGICDRMLDRCLSTGEWSDSRTLDPGTGKPPRDRDLLLGLMMRMMMILSDTDGDGVLSPREIQAVKDRVYGRGEPADTPPRDADSRPPARTP